MAVKIRSGLMVLLIALPGVVSTGVQAQITENNPRLSLPSSRLHRDYEQPIFITGHVGLGGAFQYDQGKVNYGTSLIFRPGSAANFLDFLYNMNSAMVLRLDVQNIGDEARVFSGDFILRKYFEDRGREQSQVLPFVGLGIGASDVTLPLDAGGGGARYWSFTGEVGQEWYFRPQLVVVARAQYRWFSSGDVFVSTWTVSGAVGIPVPW